MFNKIFLVTILTALSTQAVGEVAPHRGNFDPRVRKIEYNPDDVVSLTTFYGVSTHVQFNSDEKIMDIAAGDSGAWKIKKRSDRHLFIKPRATNADTNLTIVTDKRTYHFVLNVRESAIDNPKAWRDPSLIYSLTFNYPDEEAAARLALENVRQERDRKKHLQDKLDTAKKAILNYDYWLAGALEVSPTEAYDDGRFTRLVFGNNRDMPAIYAVDAEEKESLINTNVEGNTIVIHRVYRKLILRKGNFVSCLVNKNFDFDKGRDNTTGTIADDVKRVVKGTQE